MAQVLLGDSKRGHILWPPAGRGMPTTTRGTGLLPPTPREHEPVRRYLYVMEGKEGLVFVHFNIRREWLEKGKSNQIPVTFFVLSL